MGVPARKLAADARGAGRERSSHLRLVSDAPRPQRAAHGAARTPSKQAIVGPAEAACKSAFQIATIVLLTLTVLALARVTLSAKAAEASIDQVGLERSIKAESRVGDALELDRSLLVTPSRIESIAVGLQMTKAPAVRYIAVTEPAATPPTQKAPERPVAAASVAGEGQTLAGMLGTALEVTQKEARTLLVGDVGVAASR